VNMIQLDSTVAITVQRAFSLAHNVNLLAANIGSPYSSGSGIYSAGVPLNYTWPFENDNTLLISKLPKIPPKRGSFQPTTLSSTPTSSINPSVMSSTSQFDDNFSTPNVSRSFLATEGLTQTFNLTINNLTCIARISIKAASSPPSWFAVIAAQGYFEKVLPVAGCTLSQCNSEKCESANFSQSKTVFSHVELSVNFPSGAIVYPTVLTSGHRLPDRSSFNFTGNTLSSLYTNSSFEGDFLYNSFGLSQIFSFNPTNYSTRITHH